MTAMGAHARAQPAETPLRAILPNARRVALMPGPVCSPRLPRRSIKLLPLGRPGAARHRTLCRWRAPVAAVVRWCITSDAVRMPRAGRAAPSKHSNMPEDRAPSEGVLITATGCSAHLKDLEHLFLDDPSWLTRARAFAHATRDFLDLATSTNGVALPRRLRVAWQAPCSLQNGVKLAANGETLLNAAGFETLAIPEGHLCCGSAGSYSILQPEISGRLVRR